MNQIEVVEGSLQWKSVTLVITSESLSLYVNDQLEVTIVHPCVNPTNVSFIHPFNLYRVRAAARE